MRYVWPWLTARWLEHQACKGHVPPRRDPPPGYPPPVGIAQNADLRWMVRRRWR